MSCKEERKVRELDDKVKEFLVKGMISIIIPEIISMYSKLTLKEKMLNVFELRLIQYAESYGVKITEGINERK